MPPQWKGCTAFDCNTIHLVRPTIYLITTVYYHRLLQAHMNQSENSCQTVTQHLRIY